MKKIFVLIFFLALSFMGSVSAEEAQSGTTTGSGPCNGYPPPCN